MPGGCLKSVWRVSSIHGISEWLSGKSGQAMSGKVKSGQVKSGQVESGQVKSGQIKSGQDRSSQDRSGQDKSSYDRTHKLKSFRTQNALENLAGLWRWSNLCIWYLFSRLSQHPP